MTISWQMVPYTIPLAYPIQTATSACSQRQGWHVVLRWGPHVGLGDLATWPGFGPPLPTLAQGLIQALGTLRQSHGPPQDVADFASWAAAFPPGIWQGPVGFALELALFDCYSQQADLPLRRWLTPSAHGIVQSHRIVSCEQDYRQAAEAKLEVVKIKWLPHQSKQQIEQIIAWQQQTPHGPQVRLDGNGALDVHHLQELGSLLQRLDLSWLEQPLPPGQEELLLDWATAYRLPIAFDETMLSLRQDGAWPLWLDHPMVVGFVLKPMYVGGLQASRKLADRLRRLGKQVIWTHTFESCVGRMAVAQLAAAEDEIRGPAPYHGLGQGPLPGGGPDPLGRWSLPSHPGLGIPWKDVQRWHDR